MADEITVTASLSYSRGGSKASLSGSGKFDGGNFYVHNIATVGVVEESLFTGEMDPGTGAGEVTGVVMFTNLDETNYVEIGPEPAFYSIKLLPGQSAGPMPWSGDGLYAKANTGALRLEYAFVSQS